MTVVASYGMVLCNGGDDAHHRYRGRIEKVKFGVPINEAFAHDIPATLLVLLLKVNKEGPLKKDIWRAPGNQAQVRKLSHVMQHGRLVNIANFSVYTAASVIKKFLSKLPGGIFGPDNEQLLFNSVLNNGGDVEKQRDIFFRLFCSLPVPSQHLLVLLFGTFRQVADGAEQFNTKMTPDAIGISVAPSLFHSCIHDGQKAKMEDVQRFKLASQVVSKIITSFGHTHLFPRECYEFYARITGRTLRVDENWLFTFQYPSRAFSHPEVIVSDLECEDDDEGAGHGEAGPSRRRMRGPAARLAERITGRLSSSVGEVMHRSCGGGEGGDPLEEGDGGDEECLLWRQAEGARDSTRSLTFLDGVHEKQTERMKSRSEWFLSPVLPPRHASNSKSADFAHYQLLHAGDRHSLALTPELPAEEEEADRERERKEQELIAAVTAQTPKQRPPLGQKNASQSSSSVSQQQWQAAEGAMTRRRSWRMRGGQHSLDMAPPGGSLDSSEPPRTRLDSSAATHSLSNEQWEAAAGSGEEPARKRSLKKKHSMF